MDERAPAFFIPRNTGVLKEYTPEMSESTTRHRLMSRNVAVSTETSSELARANILFYVIKCLQIRCDKNPPNDFINISYPRQKIKK
jgi:hypothetical protein